MVWNLGASGPRFPILGKPSKAIFSIIKKIENTRKDYITRLRDISNKITFTKVHPNWDHHQKEVKLKTMDVIGISQEEVQNIAPLSGQVHKN